MDTRNIAVCTDFSDESLRAFPLAASIARAFSARLTLVHLAERPGVPAFASLGVGPPALPKEAAAYYDALETRLKDLIWSDATFDGVDAHARLLREGTFDALTGFLDEEDIDLLVLTTHGYTGAKRFVFGSFAVKVLHAACCPVLVRRETRAEGAQPAVEGVPRKIFVATDLSPRSAAALELACSWARRFGARLAVHFVVEKPSGIAGYPKFMLEGWWEHEQKLREESAEKITRLLEEKTGGVDATHVVTAGEPAKEILREIDEFGADLVVLGTHGRTTFEDLLLGSVVRKVLGRARCSALVIRPDPATS